MQAAGFLLAAVAVIGNDALQTLGPYLAANRGRIPWLLQALFLCSLLCGVLVISWKTGNGDPAWGRLQEFPLPERIGWIDLLPAASVLALTRWGIPVSTSLVLLTTFGAQRLPSLLSQSVLGYGVALVAGALIYGIGAWALERQVLEGKPLTHPAAWLVGQWLSTGWLWSQWLVQDLANLYVVLPRRLSGLELGGTLAALCLGLSLLVAAGGGPIQERLSRKANAGDPRSTTVIATLFGLILFGFARWSPQPMSTTWVFLGLLAGRELGILARLGHRRREEVGGELALDLLRAASGLAVSLTVVLLVQRLHQV